jgi:hypothetical protein
MREQGIDLVPGEARQRCHRDDSQRPEQPPLLLHRETHDLSLHKTPPWANFGTLAGLKPGAYIRSLSLARGRALRQLRVNKLRHYNGHRLKLLLLRERPQA